MRIENKAKAGVLWPKETERIFEEGQGEIRRARGSVAGNSAHKQGGVGAAHCGCRKRRDAVRAERRQVFRPGFEHEAVHHRVGLGKTGPEYRFHTTLEARGTISSEGVLGGDLALVGAWRSESIEQKIPYELKEEFDGPPEKVLGELADAAVAKGVKQISGDVIGDDSYFPRERYPNGWEIDDMVWEYGAAISAIVVDDNTVALTLTPGEQPGNACKRR